jgi:hypothetical protein
MTIQETITNESIERVNKMFEDFVRLYFAVVDINIYLREADEDDDAAFEQHQSPMYAEYLAEHDLPGYKLTNCLDDYQCFEGFGGYPARYEHTIKLSGDGEIHKLYKSIVESSKLNDLSDEIVLRCRFKIEGKGNSADWENLAEVHVHSISNFHLTNSYDLFARRLEKHAMVLDFGCNYFLNPDFHLSPDTRARSIYLLLTELDRISSVATERMLKLATIGNAIDVLLNAADGQSS